MAGQEHAGSQQQASGADADRIYPMRLQRFLARAGVASRRGSENLMTAGRVKVNGQVTTELGSKVDPMSDVVEVDGNIVHLADGHVYVMLYKPAGYLSTMRDPRNRPCVASLIPTSRYPGLFPVGRLDADTTGLLLFTTNGQASQQMLHPSKHVWKHYVALVEGRVSDHDLDLLRRGVDMGDAAAAPAEAELLGRRDPAAAPVLDGRVPAGSSIVGLTIHEGKKHQVKRMMHAVGHDVVRLHRDQFGPLRLTGVEPGKWRLLTDKERAAVETLVSENHHEAWLRSQEEKGRKA